MEAVPKTGTIVAGRYRVVRLAWPTAVGPVWHAKDLVLDREVLLHSLAPDLAENTEARHAFTRCGSKAAQVGGANLGQIYDSGDDPPHLVTEMPGGGRLAERLADGRLSLAETARLVLGLAGAVRSLHEHGIAHGAIAPAWIGLDEEGRPRLLGTSVADVAAIAGAVRDAPLDPPLQPAGYPGSAGEDPAAADARAVAAVALHALTGRAPGDPAARPAGSRSGIPQGIAVAVERTLLGAEGAGLDALMSAFAPYAAPAVPAEREPGFLRTEGKWLFAVLVFIGLGTAAVVAALAIGKLRPATSPQGSPAAPAATATPIAVSAAQDFDPLGDGAEHPAQAKLTIDGNPTTSWFTVGYKTADFGRGKKGLGLLFDLGSSSRVARIRVLSPLTGWQAEWRVAESRGSKPDDFSVLTTFTAAADTDAKINGGRGRYWLLWITRLTDAESESDFPFQAAVAEVEFFAGKSS